MCDSSKLTASEAKEIADASHYGNLLACKSGEGYCDDSLLNPAEAKQVAEANRQRNAIACEAGDYSCDRSLLGAGQTAAKRSKVASKSGL